MYKNGMPTGRILLDRLIGTRRRDGRVQRPQASLVWRKVWAKRAASLCIALRRLPAGRSRYRYVRSGARIKDMDMEGIDTAVNFGTTVFLICHF